VLHGGGQVVLLHGQVAGVHPLVGAVHRQQALELGYRVGMVFDPQVHQPVGPWPAGGLAPHHQDRRRLPAADVAAGRFGGLERRHQPLRQRPRRRLERPPHGRHHRVVEHHVGLDGELGAGEVPGAGDAAGAGVGGHPPLAVDEGDLPHRLGRIGRQQRPEGVGSRQAGAHQLQAPRAVGRLHERLGGHGAHARLGPGDDGAHAEPVRLDGHAHLAGARVAGDDGVGVRQRAGGRRRRRSPEGESERPDEADD